MTAPVERPQPVLEAATIGGYVQGAIVAGWSAWLIFRGGVTGDNITNLGVQINLLLSFAVAIVVYVGARIHAKAGAAKVTPLESPVNAAGVPLVPDTFPYDLLDAVKAHPRSAPKLQALITAVEARRGEVN